MNDRDTGLGILGTVALWLLAALAAISGVLWAVGSLSARVFSGAWPKARPSEMPRVLRRLHEHWLEPARAWPPRDRRLIPGPLAFYATALTLTVLAGVLALVGYRLMRPLFRRQPDGAQWATRRDLRSLIVRHPTRGRLTLGTANGALTAAEERQSVIVFGPTQTLKTTGLAIPAILEWHGPIIATSVKTDLLRDTINHRRTLGGETWIYDPARTTGLERASWTPLASCKTWSGAQRTANWLANVNTTTQGVENSAFWTAAAVKLLAPVLHAAAISGATMRDVVHWVDTQDKEESTILQLLDDAGADDAAYAFQATVGRESRTKSSIYTTAETILAAYQDPVVLDSADYAQITPERLFDGGPHTLYLAAPAHEQERLQPLFATLIQELVAAAYERATRTGQPLDPPLLLVLDECANIAPIRGLATLASTGAGQGIQLVTVFQDLAQLETTYGRDTAATIVSNHRAKLILSGISDPTTLDYATRLLGDTEREQQSATRGYHGDKSTTESTTYRQLAPNHELRQMPIGSGVLVYGRLPPARIRLRPWFLDKRTRTAPHSWERRSSL